MNFNTATLKRKASGFTIVELLIVIVIIAILAAITYVTYTGIVARANKSSAQATATAVRDKAEAFNSENNVYPPFSTNLTAGNNSLSASSATQNTTSTWYLANVTINYSTTALTNANNTSTVRVLKCAASTPSTNTQANLVGTAPTASQALISGLKIIYWDYVANAEATVLTAGDTTTNCPTS